MINFVAIGATLTRFFGRTGLLVQKHLPMILTIGGTTGLAGAGVMACVATTKIEAILDQAARELSELEKHEHTLYRNKSAYGRAVLQLKMRTARKLVRLYGPALILALASTAGIFGAQHILNVRNAAMAAAVKLIDKAFSDYRSRVVLAEGPEKDRQYRYGIREITERVLDEEGNVQEVTREVDALDDGEESMFARKFKDGNPNWCSTTEYNLFFLQKQQDYANLQLHKYGHVFLNDVYTWLGLLHSGAAAQMGWVDNRGTEPTKFIDFGIQDLLDHPTPQLLADRHNSILLDFNIDKGTIHQLI